MPLRLLRFDALGRVLYHTSTAKSDKTEKEAVNPNPLPDRSKKKKNKKQKGKDKNSTDSEEKPPEKGEGNTRLGSQVDRIEDGQIEGTTPQSGESEPEPDGEEPCMEPEAEP